MDVGKEVHEVWGRIETGRPIDKWRGIRDSVVVSDSCCGTWRISNIYFFPSVSVPHPIQCTHFIIPTIITVDDQSLFGFSSIVPTWIGTLKSSFISLGIDKGSYHHHQQDLSQPCHGYSITELKTLWSLLVWLRTAVCHVSLLKIFQLPNTVQDGNPIIIKGSPWQGWEWDTIVTPVRYECIIISNWCNMKKD